MRCDGKAIKAELSPMRVHGGDDASKANFHAILKWMCNGVEISWWWSVKAPKSYILLYTELYLPPQLFKIVLKLTFHLNFKQEIRFFDIGSRLVVKKSNFIVSIKIVPNFVFIFIQINCCFYCEEKNLEWNFFDFHTSVKCFCIINGS